jgi:hypothetical protein
VFAVAGIVSAQSPQRWEASWLPGFRSNGFIKLDSTPGVPYTKAGVGTGYSNTFTGGYRINDQNLVEFRWTRQSPDIEFEDASGTVGQTLGSTLNQYAGDFTYEFNPENNEKFHPYILGSLGVTRLGVSDKTHTRLHFGIGVGAKYWFMKNVGVRVQGAWMPTYWKRTTGGFACGINTINGTTCVFATGGQFIHQVEFSAGPVFRF